MSVRKVTSTIRGAAKYVVGKALPESDLSRRRMAICQQCPAGQYHAGSGRCRACGCFLKEKTKYEGEECPYGYW